MKNYYELSWIFLKSVRELEMNSFLVYVVHKYIKRCLFNVTKTVNLHKKDIP